MRTFIFQKNGFNFSEIATFFILSILVFKHINATTQMISFAAATWVGGAFIIGIAESVYDPTKGLIWALIPLQMSVSFVIGKSPI